MKNQFNKNESMYDSSHIWHRDPIMDNPYHKTNGSHLPTEIWKNRQNAVQQQMSTQPTAIYHNNSTEINHAKQEEKINRIENTLKKIAELLKSF